jgi:hypothetical protein
MKRKSLFWIAILAGVLSALAFVAAAAAATPITGGSSFGTAVSISPNTEYSASINNTSHTSDYFTFNAVPGQIVTVVFTSTTTFNSSGFYLYDQSHISSLAYKGVNGTEQTFQFVYMGNNTTPTKYYFVVKDPGSGANGYLFRLEIADQSDANAPGDAGDTAGTARVITPTPGASTTYSGNLLGYADDDDYFRIDAASGQIVTVTVTVLDYGTASMLRVYLTDQASTSLDYGTIYAPDLTPKVFKWMSNNSGPSAYYLHFQGNGNGLERYQFQIELGQQTDAALPGDAGDDFGTARVVTLTNVTPTLVAPRNMLGGSDSVDYYFIKLPPTGPFEAPIRYGFWIAPVDWPADSGYLSAVIYDAQRNQIPGLGGTIHAPSKNLLGNEITTCGSAGCYVKVTTGFSGYYQLQYSIRFAPIRFTYLPMIRK